MNKTKDKILKCALSLFNEKGVSQVSLRDISADMEISLGNLTYHFKKREEIIEALYLDLVSKLDHAFEKELLTENSFELLFEIPSVTLSCFYEYRFLMLDFVYINRNHDMIRNHYQKLMKVREHQFESLIQALINAKLIREEIIDNEYKYLFQNLRIVGDFWLSANYIDKNISVKQKDVIEGTQLLNQIIFPYLTAKGQSTFFKVYNL
ncbi:TetR/AcrR family transcriptional regulator [Marivirga salinae]|uniref:TetR/AcrR family transcriptional regulator n=1 Tax=Marivirga salinarum TaxID=3059078 RepID=A0AA51NBQ4_9BACT|nr:TetR/AcrR family transcriptional regulator [Marivirga sp. BDSF4-3]WMN12054.1 TetR/AcrR family transcriptional regulator [Marivirga sp. BDSF4-3]